MNPLAFPMSPSQRTLAAFATHAMQCASQETHGSRVCFLTFAFALRSHVACPDQLRFTLLACCTRVTCILYWEKRLRTTTPAVALWDTLLQGAATDVVTKHAITCCTKWSVGDRFTTNYTEWSFEYDHIFATSKLVASGAHLIPYTYRPFVPYMPVLKPETENACMATVAIVRNQVPWDRQTLR